MSASFSDWLKQEVEPKIRQIAELNLEGLAFADRTPIVAAIASAGISPFVYWQRDRASSIGPATSASIPQTTAAGTLSPRAQDFAKVLTEGKAIKDLQEQGVVFEGNTAKTKEWQPPALWSVLNEKLRAIGYAYDKGARAWVK